MDRAKIIEVGHVGRKLDGGYHISGWYIDCRNVVAPYEITNNNIFLFAGWEVELLILISDAFSKIRKN